MRVFHDGAVQGNSNTSLVTCIIPAYNEAKRIASVLDAALEAQRTVQLEIIVVNDGSNDQTAAVLKKYSDVQVITNQQNRGKSYSVATAIEHSAGEHILLLDADLIGLTADDIRALLRPLQNGDAAVTMSVRKNSFMHMRAMKLDFVTGERAFPRALVENHIDDIKNLPRFGLEVYLNNLIIQQKCAVKTVYWKTVCHTKKSVKRGFYQSIIADIKMARDILHTISLPKIALQHVALLKLSIKSNA